MNFRIKYCVSIIWVKKFEVSSNNIYNYITYERYVKIKSFSVLQNPLQNKAFFTNEFFEKFINCTENEE
jgi:hypothetical protein